MQEYKIKVEAFEGPMDVLMHLIDKSQIDIYDIPIAIITEQYLEYLRALEFFNIEVASEFLVMAATLLQIKSRMLLPKPPKLEEEEDLVDPRQELVNRLIEYKQFKQISTILEEMAETRGKYFFRQKQEFSSDLPLPEGLTIDDLLVAFAAVWESQLKEPVKTFVAREEVTMQDKMQDIIYLLRSSLRLTFAETIIRSGGKSEIVAAFLALLELIRLKRVTISQEKIFGEIYITLTNRSD